MQPMLTPPDNGEGLLRERILQQEYAFDEQAWDNMEALLEERDRTVVPNPATDTLPTPGGSLYKSLVLLLIGSAFSLLWFGSKSQSNAATLPENSNNARASVRPAPSSAPAPESAPETLGIPPAASHPALAPITKNTVPKPATSDKTAGQKQNRENQPTPKSEAQPVQRLYQKGATLPGTIKSPQLPASAEPAQANTVQTNLGQEIALTDPYKQNPEAPQPISAEPATPGTSNSNAAIRSNTDITLIPQALASILPPAADLPLKNLSLELPKPAPVKPLKRSKLQYHVLAGMSLAAVDLNELQLRWAPHVGIGISRTLAPGYRIQAELTGKIVKGYEFQSVLSDTLLLANGVGFRSLNFSGNTLQYLEMPILIKRQSPEHRFNWFAGLRPSVNWSKGASVIAETSGYSQQTALADFNTVPANVELRRGLRRFDLGMVLGVECRISRNLSMNLRFNQGLFDLTHDNFFQLRENTLNTDAQLSVQMSF